jgi:hypothetical protein
MLWRDGFPAGAPFLNAAFWLEPLELARSHGLSTAASAGNDPRIQKVRVTKDQIVADLVDGRVISVPLAWSWRLSEATPAQRANFRLIEDLCSNWRPLRQTGPID